MASENVRVLLTVALAAALTGCIAVENKMGLHPPVALCSHFRATVGCPRESVPCGAAVEKIGRTDGSVMIKEWVYSGISADVVDMALKKAVENGGLKKLYYADYEQTSYFGFVTIFNLVAYGE